MGFVIAMCMPSMAPRHEVTHVPLFELIHNSFHLCTSNCLMNCELIRHIDNIHNFMKD
jgi:hypothetical protein